MLDGGDRACAMEVSSHALELHRADAIHFAAAIFTNLTQDHLDFHPTMEDYFHAKRRLFAGSAPRRRDHQRRRPVRRAGSPTSSSGAVTFALDARRRLPRRATSRRDLARLPLHACTRPTASVELRSPLRGRFNVYNVLGALAAARALGVPLDDAARPRSRPPGRCPGRFEPVDEGQPFAVLVDYAHTPDSLENVLQAARRARRDGPAARRVRLRRRPRPRQAAADGRDRGAARRPRDRHLRQPALGGPRGDHRGDPRRHPAATSSTRSTAGGDRAGDRRAPSRATWS